MNQITNTLLKLLKIEKQNKINKCKLNTLKIEIENNETDVIANRNSIYNLWSKTNHHCKQVISPLNSVHSIWMEIRIKIYIKEKTVAIYYYVSNDDTNKQKEANKEQWITK